MKKIGFLLAICVLAGSVWAMPYYTLYSIKQGVETKDADQLEQHIDFVSVRSGLKTQIEAGLHKVFEEKMQGSPLAAMGMAFASKMTEAMVEPILQAYVTPEGMASLMKGEVKDLSQVQKKHTPAEPPNTSSEPVEPKQQPLLQNASVGYRSMSEFVVELPVENDKSIVFLLTRSGITWQLSQVQLPGVAL